MKRIIILTLLTVLIFVSCRKNSTYTLEGRIMIDCDTPLSNANLELHETYNEERILAHFKTSSDGYFKVTYTKIPSATMFNHLYPAKVKIIASPMDSIKVYFNKIDGNRNFDFETMPILRIHKSVQFVLDVENPYTAEHVLRFPDYRLSNPYSNPIEIQGPFNSGVLYTVDSLLMRPEFHDFTKKGLRQPNDWLNTLIVEQYFSGRITGPNTGVTRGTTGSFGLQCEPGLYQVVIKIH